MPALATSPTSPRAEPHFDNDEALMARYQLGDGAAFNMLYARHQAPLYRYILRTVLAPQVAGDVFQDAWLKLVQAANTWHSEQKVAPWLYTVARNRALDHVRAFKNQVFAEPDYDVLPMGSEADLDRLELGHVVHNQHLGAALIAAIEALPVPQREAFVLQADAGMGVDDIAQLTQSPSETVKSRLRYARTALRTALKQGGWHD